MKIQITNYYMFTIFTIFTNFTNFIIFTQIIKFNKMLCNNN